MMAVVLIGLSPEQNLRQRALGGDLGKQESVRQKSASKKEKPIKNAFLIGHFRYLGLGPTEDFWAQAKCPSEHFSEGLGLGHLIVNSLALLVERALTPLHLGTHFSKDWINSRGFGENLEAKERESKQTLPTRAVHHSWAEVGQDVVWGPKSASHSHMCL